MPDLDELYPGRFLKGKTLERPITIRIVSVGGEPLEGDDGAKVKGVLKYRTKGPDGKPVVGEIIWNKTNALLAAAVFGTRDYTAWVGHTLTIRHDPGVMLAGEKVGGIRVVGSPELQRMVTVDIKRPRRKKPERYTLHPTDAQGRVRATKSATPSATPAPTRCPDCGVSFQSPDEAEAHACQDGATP
jgi:hypothetical protein